ncbi:FecCD family ABC transporter permease [Sphingomonas montana]|uniref:FecCD family ABC transporter permease n=1 Tax=Sphingomonas montana TaxID=1843236 RepID=UPI001F0AFE25|nr:iron ABC transporter permease [Sphingomonas montana]
MGKTMMPAAAVRRAWLIPTLILLAAGLAVLSLATGQVPLSVGRVLTVLGGRGDAVAATIVLDLRLPRTLLALGVGAILGLSGAVMQGYLRNPLAEPSVLGTSNAGALGAVIALYYGLDFAGGATLPLLSVAGAVAGLVPLMLIAGRTAGPLALILAGVAVSALAGAGISLALNFAPNPFAAVEIMTWLMGSLEDRSFRHVAIAAPCLFVGAVLLAWDGRALDALSLGEDAARTLGVDLPAMRARMLAGLAIGIGGAVAVSGAIGFVGLIVPHLVRPLTDRAPSSALLPSALGGAVLLTAADLLVRVVPTEQELRLGVVTAVLGVPVFLHHLLKERRGW